MATKHPRLNVVLESTLYAGISHLAQKEGVSRSLMARDLIKEALELHEDLYWQESAEKRDRTLPHTKALSHKKIWKS